MGSFCFTITQYQNENSFTLPFYSGLNMSLMTDYFKKCFVYWWILINKKHKVRNIKLDDCFMHNEHILKSIFFF